MAWSRSEDEALFHALEPEARLVAAVVRLAVRDAGDHRLPAAARAQARAFLCGAGTLPLLCQVGGVALPLVLTRAAEALAAMPDVKRRPRRAPDPCASAAA